MSERNGYEPGVPWRVDTIQPDPDAAADFSTRLFGWDATPMGDYAVCRLRADPQGAAFSVSRVVPA
jgi:hypothetical protein